MNGIVKLTPRFDAPLGAHLRRRVPWHRVDPGVGGADRPFVALDLEEARLSNCTNWPHRLTGRHGRDGPRAATQSGGTARYGREPE
jgi:hypothetical protein